MGRKKIKVPARGGKIRIKRDRDDEPSPPDRPPEEDQPQPDQTPNDDNPSSDGEGIEILENAVVNQMEDKAISQVRPDDEDVEMLYALTGQTRHRIDAFHSLASANVVSEANYDSIHYNQGQIIHYIEHELSYTPQLFILVHTHPRRSEPRPSAKDKTTWSNSASEFKDDWDGARVCFGIHAFTAEFNRPKSRSSPAHPAGDSTVVEWRSPTRDHAFRPYTPDATGIEVTLV